LWIAKFPSGHDTKNIGAWEAVTAELASGCGIQVSKFQAQQFSSKDHTFLTKRFDRSDNGRRIHFASAMTLLGYTDGADSEKGVSYLELAEWTNLHSEVEICRLLKLDDIGVIEIIQENPYMQYFLGLKGFTQKPVFDPSLLVYIRKRIDLNVFESLTDELIRKGLNTKQAPAKETKDDDDDPTPGRRIQEQRETSA